MKRKTTSLDNLDVASGQSDVDRSRGVDVDIRLSLVFKSSLGYEASTNATSTTTPQYCSFPSLSAPGQVIYHGT